MRLVIKLESIWKQGPTTVCGPPLWGLSGLNTNSQRINRGSGCTLLPSLIKRSNGSLLELTARLKARINAHHRWLGAPVGRDSVEP
jgi:hypothetical protein